MSHYLLPAAYALFIWWFSTGVIIYLDGLPRHTFRWSLMGATLVAVAAFYGLSTSSGTTSVRSAYEAFTCGLLAWSWLEITFYMGFVTGPRKEPCAEGCRGWRHFGHAIETSLYHELAILAGALLVVLVTRSQPNQIGCWTFIVLWWMHQSAKLNVFLGVPNLNEEFFPEHMQYLRRFLTKKPINLLFPLSVTVSTVIAVLLAQQALRADASDFHRSGYTFLTTLMGLAILEHWFLVLPLPTAALWHWGLKSRPALKPFDVDIAAGFLGSGKTTFLHRMLSSVDPNVRTVALVNDFSELGVDGALLRGRGADVVELPNGCICCSLKKDLTQSLKDIVAKWSPERVFIEPSGVADVGSLVNVLHQPGIAPLVRTLRTHTVIDAGAFLRDYERLPDHFEAQADLASEFILNKTDIISAAELQAVASTLRALNPRSAIVPCVYGVVDKHLQDRLKELRDPVAESSSLRASQAGNTCTPDGKAHAHGHSHPANIRRARFSKANEEIAGNFQLDHTIGLGLEILERSFERPV